MSQKDQIQVFKRVPTHIPGLDEMLCGGFLKGGIYLVMGTPGAGKTILGTQFGFNHCERGGRALYVSLLSEGHGRLFGHLKPMSFFDEAPISETFNFISAYQTLEKEGLDGLLRSLAHMVRQYRADLLFLDGVASAEDLAKSTVSFKKFVHDLSTVLAASGCTAVLLSSFTHSLTYPEHTMVDGILSLSSQYVSMRSVREIEIMKLRGSDHFRGKHFFEITDNGITVYPRIEVRWKNHQIGAEDLDEKLSTGISRLDKILDGGVNSSTMTALLGAAGTGKTLLGCQFLAAGGDKKEPGLYVGFYESPNRLVKKVGNIKINLDKHVKAGLIHLIWHPPQEHTIDQIAEKIVSYIIQHRIKRLFLDGAGGLKEGMIEPVRLYRALAALANRLRSLKVTTFFSEETKLFPIEISTPISDQSAITDNIIFLRHAELNAEFTRFISVIKSRESDASTCIYVFNIGAKGLEIGEQLKDAEGIITGTPKFEKRSKSAEIRKKSRRKK
jgi:circadian clock protein KaiC